MNEGNEYQQSHHHKKTILTPAQVLVLGFAAVILMGALLLTLPQATVDGQGLGFLDALFTSTSAVCVTGLVVVDTGTTFTIFGQLVILTLIQIGGLGFMTFATFFAIMLGKRITLKDRLLLQEALNQASLEGIVRLAKHVIQMAFAIEALGALILTLHWYPSMGWGKAVYFGIFHSISAFNNAGFDLFGNYASLTGSVDDWVVNLVIMGLIITGGLGFAVLADMYPHRRKKYALHTKMVLQATAFLIVLGTVLIFALEYTNLKTLGGLTDGTKLLASLFQSVSPRTAGFNTLNLPDLRDATVIIIIALMFIGASPGSTGGGIKTTTFVSFVLLIRLTIKGTSQATFRERTIPMEIMHKAVAVIGLALLLIFIDTLILTMTENADLKTVLFEVTSAFGTVGLTLGLTPNLTSIGKIVILLTMFAGRVGLLTFVFALARRGHTASHHIKYPEERILIG